MRPRRARRIARLYGGAELCGILTPVNRFTMEAEAEFRRGNDRVWIRRQHGCPFNLYASFGSDAYRLTASFPKNWSAERAANALRENGFEQVGGFEQVSGFAVVADVEIEGIQHFRYTDRRYRYASMRRALQTLANLRRIKLGGEGWNWKVVHYYPVPA